MMENWHKLDPFKQLKLTQKMRTDPLFFLENEYFLDITPRPKQAEIFNEFYKDMNAYDHLIVAAGRRAGKTFLGASMSCYEQALLLSLPDPAKYFKLKKGSEIFIVNLAVSEDQSKDTIFGQTKGMVQTSPYLMSFNPEIYSTEIRYPKKHLTVKALGSSGASGVGRTCKMVFLDEIVKFDETESERSQWQVYFNMSAATKDFEMQGHTVIISSVKHENDLLWTLYKRAQLMDNMLAYKLTTWEMNPAITRASLQSSFDIDPAAAAREWGASPYMTSDTYFSLPHKVNDAFSLSLPNALDPNFNPPLPMDIYVLGLDPASRVDAFGFSLARLNATWGVEFVGLYRMVPSVEAELSPSMINRYVMNKMRAYNIMYAVIDTPMFPQLRENMYSEGCHVEIHQVKKEHYDQMKEGLYTGNVTCIQNETALNELKSLILIRGAKVDHPRKGSKDIADAMCNAHWMLTESELIDFPEDAYFGKRGKPGWQNHNLDSALRNLSQIPLKRY